MEKRGGIISLAPSAKSERKVHLAVVSTTIDFEKKDGRRRDGSSCIIQCRQSTAVNFACKGGHGHIPVFII